MSCSSLNDIKLLLLAEQLYIEQECDICISRSLNEMVADHHTQLDQYLQSTMFALLTKQQLTTRYSPYFLMFGRERFFMTNNHNHYN